MTVEKSIVVRVENVVANHITPLFAIDHGSLEVVEVVKKNGLVKVRLGGTYRGSPSRETLIKYVVEPVLKQELDDIHAVELVD
ncbi:MAG: NifU family protein [Deltaproteobacteria bacterium]|nr:NifU family protein [Deltaproteobacteria bacterium]